MTSTTATTSRTRAPKAEPPPAAVAADAHWAAKMARLRERQQPTYTLRICDDDAAKTRLAQAERLQRRTQEDLTLAPGDKELQARAQAASAALAAAEKAVQDATLMVLTFRGLPRPDYVALVKAHPPTEEQAGDGMAWNEDTFGPALIAAASVDGMSEDDARELLATWAPAEAGALFQAAYQPQQDDRTDLGKG